MPRLELKLKSLLLLLLLSLSIPVGAQELRYLQGGLVDLRYGQASIDTGGAGALLQWNDQTRFTIDGSECGADDLTTRLAEGIPLIVATAFTPDDGMMKVCDAVSSEPVPAVELQLEPWRPILATGSRLSVSVSQSEARRLNLVSPRLFLPGAGMEQAFSTLPNGALRSRLTLRNGWNWKDLPLFVLTRDGRAFRGKSLSVSSTGPRIGRVGPAVASTHLNPIPGYFELEGNTTFLDFASVRLIAPTGVEILKVYPRPDRVDFTMTTIGPGTYLLKAEVSDLLGRQATKSWSFSVR